MRVTFDPFTWRYTVKDIGSYNTREEAEAALRAKRKDAVLCVAIRQETKETLKEIARQKHVTVSRVVREIIERGVSDYGKEKEK